jgi:hypothetical protein
VSRIAGGGNTRPSDSDHQWRPGVRTSISTVRSCRPTVRRVARDAQSWLRDAWNRDADRQRCRAYHTARPPCRAELQYQRSVHVPFTVGRRTTTFKLLTTTSVYAAGTTRCVSAIMNCTTGTLKCVTTTPSGATRKVQGPVGHRGPRCSDDETQFGSVQIFGAHRGRRDDHVGLRDGRARRHSPLSRPFTAPSGGLYEDSTE